MPPFEKGLHLMILDIVRNVPLIIPNLSKDSIPYWEHEGKYGHLVPLYGEIYF